LPVTGSDVFGREDDIAFLDAAWAKPQVNVVSIARQVTECRQLDGSTPKPAQKWDPWKLLDKVEEWVKAGIKVYSCYEAGACGYWYHRELIKRGAVNFVVAPRPLENQRSKHQKTDRLDARALLDNLESYLRGNRDAISIVAVPSLEQEQQRSVVRYRERSYAIGVGPRRGVGRWL
jgi:transposase